MNKDSKLIFEAYLNKKASLLNELDVGADFAGGALEPIKKSIKSSLKSGSTKASERGYLIDNIATGLNISHDQAVELLGNKVFNKVFKQKPITINGKEYPFSNDAKNEDQFRSVLKNAVIQSIKEIKSEHPTLKLPGADAQNDYTSRVISNLGGFAKDFTKGKFGGSKEAKGQVKKAVNVADKSPKSALPAEVPPTEDTPDEDVNVDKYITGDFPTSTKDYKDILEKLKPVYKVNKGEDVLESPELKADIDAAIAELKDINPNFDVDAETFLSDAKFHRDENKKPVFRLLKPGEDVPQDGEGDSTPEEILKDIELATGRKVGNRGFDFYDKFSSDQ